MHGRKNCDLDCPAVAIIYMGGWRKALHSSIALFPRCICSGHALCMKAAMLKILHRLKILRRAATSMEPGPTFASDAEIELAAKLRQQLEERYFEASLDPSSPMNRLDKRR